VCYRDSKANKTFSASSRNPFDALASWRGADNLSDASSQYSYYLVPENHLAVASRAHVLGESPHAVHRPTRWSVAIAGTWVNSPVEHPHVHISDHVT